MHNARQGSGRVVESDTTHLQELREQCTTRRFGEEEVDQLAVLVVGANAGMLNAWTIEVFLEAHQSFSNRC